MHKRIASAIIVAVLLVSGLMVVGCPVPVAPSETITILVTNDLHGRVRPFARPDGAGTVGGLARIASVVETVRTEGVSTIVLDGGDTLHGTGIAHFTQGQVLMKAMNHIGYDAMVVGNHDFNWGIDPLFAAKEEARFPFLSANLLWREDNFYVFLPYIILEQDGVRIGVLGLSPTINRYRHQGAPDPRARIDRVDPVEVAKELVPALRQQVDLLVVLSHLGHPTDRVLAKSVEGIDIILGASTHWLLTEPVRVGEPLIVEQGWRGEFMSRIDLTIQEGEKIGVQHRLIHLDGSITPNPEVQAIIDAAYADFPEANRAVGYSATDIWPPAFNPFAPKMMPFLPEPEPGSVSAGINDDIRRGVITFWDSRAPHRLQETVLGNFITDAIRYESGTDVAVQRAGCIRAGVARGEITVDDLFTMLPFDMSIVVYNLSGELLRQLLEVSVGVWPSIPGGANFLQVSGLEFTFDPTLAEGRRVTNVFVAGAPLDPDKIYSVGVTHSPRGSVWGRALRNIFGQGEFVRNTGVFVRDAFAKYLETHSPISPAIEGRITVAGTGEAVGTTTITILHTGDLHGHLDPFKPRRAEEYIGGIARIATLVNQIRAEEPNTILLDAGDTIHGTNLANLLKGESVIAAMNAIGYDAMTVGNHDFNYRLHVLQERAEQADFPILAANVRYKTGEPVPFLKPYAIVETGGLRIGIIGLVTTYTPVVTHPKNVEDLEFLDPAEVVKGLVEKLDPKVDLIILLAHIGSAAEEAVLEAVPGIAVSVSAHTHETRVTQIGDTILVDSGAFGAVLGRLDIEVKDGRVIGFCQAFLPITPAIEADPAVDAILVPFRAAIEGLLAEEVGEAAIVLEGERADVRSRETNLGNLIADILRARTGADIAIQNGGGIRMSIDVGPITLDEIFTVLPFDNYVVALELTGETILAALENSVSLYPDLHGRFPQVSGMSFLFDPAQPAGERIVEVTIGGEPLDLTRTYTVATNDFMAGGGDGYTMLKEAEVVLETGDFLRDVVAAYIAAHSPVAPQVEGRIRKVEPVVTAVHLTIVHTNDFHGRVAPFDRPDADGTVGGLARIATVIDEIRAEGRPVMVFDSGDTIHGTGIAHYTEGIVVIEAMNAIGYDAMVVGNHEFNWGLRPLFAAEGAAEFPFLSANLVYSATGERLFAPYKIIEQSGVRIGVLALSAAPNLQHDEVIGVVSRQHPVVVAQEFVAALQGEVDLLIVLSHLGHFEERAVAISVPGIDLILGGHTHFLLVEPVRIGDALIFENGWLGERIRRLDLTIEDGRLIDVAHRLIDIDDSIAHIPEVEAIVAAAYAANPHLHEAVGCVVDHLESPLFVISPETKVMLQHARLAPPIDAVLQDVVAGTVILPRRATDSFQETALGNAVADSIRHAANADIAVVQSGWIREGISKGPITRADLFRIHPFDPPILVHRLTGAQIVALLERSVAAFPVPHGGFLQVSGLSFKVNPLRPAGERVSGIYINGAELVIDRLYSVAGTFPLDGEFVHNTGVLVRDAMAAYFSAHVVMTPQVDGRIVIQAIP